MMPSLLCCENAFRRPQKKVFATGFDCAKPRSHEFFLPGLKVILEQQTVFTTVISLIDFDV